MVFKKPIYRRNCESLSMTNYHNTDLSVCNSGNGNPYTCSDFSIPTSDKETEETSYVHYEESYCGSGDHVDEDNDSLCQDQG